MSPTADYIISNQSGASFRTDLNNTLAAIVSNNSNSSSPATTYAYQWWADTSTGTLKIRNSANNAWIELLQLDGTLTLEDGSASAPALSFRDDLDTGVFSSSANTFCVATAGVIRMELGTSSTIFNDGGGDVDFRIESDSSSHMFFIDAGNNRIGIGTSSPSVELDLSGALKVSGLAQFANTINLTHASAGSNIIYFTEDLQFTKNGTGARLKIDTSGRLLIGTTTNTFTGVGSSKLQVSGTGADTAGAALIRTSNDAGGAYLQFVKNRGGATQAGDNCGGISWMGHDGTDVESYLAQLIVKSDATATSNSMTGRMEFHTANGSSVPTERLRLEPTGALRFVGTTSRQGNTNSICAGSGNSIDINYTEYFYVRRGNSTETLRADSTGKLGIGTTSLNARFTVAVSAAVLVPVDVNDTSNTSTFTHRVRFLTGGTEVGRIRSSNSATVYDTSASDITLKKNFEDWTENTLDLFKNINPQKFNFIQEDDGTTKSKGFIAQEMVDSFPEAYTKEDKKDSKYFFNPSGMVVYLMKAIQELESKVAALEAA